MRLQGTVRYYLAKDGYGAWGKNLLLETGKRWIPHLLQQQVFTQLQYLGEGSRFDWFYPPPGELVGIAFGSSGVAVNEAQTGIQGTEYTALGIYPSGFDAATWTTAAITITRGDLVVPATGANSVVVKASFTGYKLSTETPVEEMCLLTQWSKPGGGETGPLMAISRFLSSGLVISSGSDLEVNWNLTLERSNG